MESTAPSALSVQNLVVEFVNMRYKKMLWNWHRMILACTWSRRSYYFYSHSIIVLSMYISGYVRVRTWSIKNLNNL